MKVAAVMMGGSHRISFGTYASAACLGGANGTNAACMLAPQSNGIDGGGSYYFDRFR